MSNKNKEKIAFVLSGGGARAVAHLGMMQALEERGIKPDAISGSSTGALTGLLYACGLSPEQILDLFKKEGLINLINPKPGVTGMLESKSYVHKLLSYFEKQSFSDLNLPVFICVLNFMKGKAEYFDSGNLKEPLEAALSIPGAFKPVQIGEHLYADGGSVDNLPVEPVSDYGTIYGFHVNPLVPKNTGKGLGPIMLRTLDIVLYENVKKNIKKCTRFLEPDKMAEFLITDFSNINEIYEVGYNYAKKLTFD